MHERIAEAEPVEAAWTEDLFDFTFPVWSQQNQRAASGIIRNDSGRRIFGCVYALPSDLVFRDIARPGRKTFDQIEGEGINYDRRSIWVTAIASKRRLEVITYLPKGSTWRSPTNAEYADHILTGLDEWGAPPDYVEYVQAIVDRALEGVR
jgi:hypothetical protein